MALKEITLANFYAGLSENRYFGAEKGQFQYAKNVDMQAEVRGMRLIGQQATDIASLNGNTGDVTLMQRLEDWFPNASGWIHVTNGQFLLNGSLVATVSAGIKGWQKIVIAGNNYVYLFGNSAVDVYAVGTNTYTTAVASISGTTAYRPTINAAGAVFVGVGDKVYSVSGVSPTTATVLLTIGQGEDITALTRFSTEFKIYSKV